MALTDPGRPRGMNRGRRNRGDPRRLASQRVVGALRRGEGRPPTLEEFLASAFVWLSVGLLVGLPVSRWLVPWLATGFSAGKWGLGTVVLGLLLLVTAGALLWIVLARFLNVLRGRSRRAGLLVPTTLGICALVAGWAWWGIGGSGQEWVILTELDGRFAFGPPLTRDRMARLKEEGFVGVVSLLHPEGSDAERELLRRERAWAAGLGLEVVSAPMRPEVELNEDALETLRHVAASGKGPYYVHAGADRNRLELARNLLIRATGGPAALRDRLADIRAFERGPVYRLDDGVFLTPFPTDSELLNYYLGGSAQTVVSLLDPTNPDEADWIERESHVLAPFGIELREAPISAERPFDPATAVRAAEVVRSSARPVIVHTFLIPSVPAQAFRQAYLGGVPPLPPRLVDQRLKGGDVRVVAPNVAVGPRPTGPEFGLLYVLGVRTIVCLGATPAGRLDEDRRLSRVAGLDWSENEDDAEVLLTRLARGGPWYLYGPGSSALSQRVADRYGPAIPALTDLADSSATGGKHGRP